MSEPTFIEPILKPDDNRFVMFPIKHNDIWEMYKRQVDCFWRSEEIDLSNIQMMKGINTNMRAPLTRCKIETHPAGGKR
jgi:hypothetical protein